MINLDKVDKKVLFNHYCNTLEREIDLNNRIDKAIEYIEHKAKIKEYFMVNGKEYNELLDILKGSDKE